MPSIPNKDVSNAPYIRDSVPPLLYPKLIPEEFRKKEKHPQMPGETQV